MSRVLTVAGTMLRAAGLAVVFAWVAFLVINWTVEPIGWLLQIRAAIEWMFNR